jgi:hypothetical protein
MEYVQNYHQVGFEVERVGDELAVVGAGLDEEAVSLGPI